LILRAIRESKGICEKVSDSQIIEAFKLLTGEGMFVEPSAAASMAGVRKLIDTGKLDRESKIVCVLTGHGLKDLQTAERNSEIYLKIKPISGEIAKIH